MLLQRTDGKLPTHELLDKFLTQNQPDVSISSPKTRDWFSNGQLSFTTA